LLQRSQPKEVTSLIVLLYVLYRVELESKFWKLLLLATSWLLSTTTHCGFPIQQPAMLSSTAGFGQERTLNSRFSKDYRMRKLIVLWVAFFSLHAYASDSCDQRAALASSMVATKHSVRQDLRAKPVSGPTGEVWRYLAYLSANEHEKLGDTPEQIKHIAKLIAENDASNDWRIEALVYNEFFRAVCEAKLSVLDIPSVNGEALGGCFGEAPPGKRDFLDCVRAEVSKINNGAYAR
jgi:hypothetical protein